MGPLLTACVRALTNVVVPERIYAVSFNERIRHVHFLLLPRTATMPRGHVISDIYRRIRSLLRKVGVARNPTPEARAAVAVRVREELERS